MLIQSQVDLLQRFEGDLQGIDAEDEADVNQEFWALLHAIDHPEQLHYLPFLLNWDDCRTKPALEWILAQRLCDAGTALAIYWLNGPIYWKEAEACRDIRDFEREMYDFHCQIETRYLRGDFNRGGIHFNPRDGRFLPLDPLREAPAHRLVPEQMKKATPGVILPPFEELRARRQRI